MNIAVKLYQSVTNKPEGMPDAWPAETVTLGESTTLPDGDGWILMTEEEFIAHKASNQADYTAYRAPIIAAEEAAAQEAGFRHAVMNAIDFGQSLIVEFSAMNAINQLSSAQIIEISQRLAGIQMLLNTGALYTAYEAMDSVTTDELLPQAIIDIFKQKIADYLGI